MSGQVHPLVRLEWVEPGRGVRVDIQHNPGRMSQADP